MNTQYYEIIPVTALKQNCTLQICPDTREAVLIDPGGDADLIMKKILELALNVTQIWITHNHFDHVGAVAEMSRRLAIPILGPERADEAILIGGNAVAKQFGFDPVEFFHPTHWFRDQEKIQVGQRCFEVRHMPGHSPGHVIFIDAKNDLIQMGDVLFAGSIGRTDLPGGNATMMKQSLRCLFENYPEKMQFIPGHGPLSTLGIERLQNPYIQQLLAVN